MQQEFYNQVQQFNKSVYAATKQLTDINVRTYERLVQEQFDIVGKCLEGGVKQFEMVRDANDILGYVTAQREQLQKYSENLQLSAEQTQKILSETRDEYDSWVKEGLSELSSLSSVPKSKTA